MNDDDDTNPCMVHSVTSQTDSEESFRCSIRVGFCTLDPDYNFEELCTVNVNVSVDL